MCSRSAYDNSNNVTVTFWNAILPVALATYKPMKLQWNFMTFGRNAKTAWLGLESDHNLGQNASFLQCNCHWPGSNFCTSHAVAVELSWKIIIGCICLHEHMTNWFLFWKSIVSSWAKQHYLGLRNYLVTFSSLDWHKVLLTMSQRKHCSFKIDWLVQTTSKQTLWGIVYLLEVSAGGRERNTQVPVSSQINWLRTG